MGHTVHSHWHKIIEDIASLALAGGSVAGLYQAVQNRKITGNPIMLALTCGGCLGGIVLAADKLNHNHLHPDAESVAITCPDCGHSGNHHYHGAS